MKRQRRKVQVSDDKLPGPFQRFVSRFPAIGEAHERVTAELESAGPLDRKVCELIKIGICVGGGLESALKSHVRRALQAGATSRAIEQTIALGMTTAGFPRTVAAWTWAESQFEREQRDREQGA